ncbi:MAG: GGDEF domain-containing protein, partial [Bacteroidaceae bacterium]|nr:GGDEF domain-containing protein [Bacteroidaceae bacterium]
MNQSNIQLRLYKTVLLVGACLSVICIIGNYFSAFPFKADLKWIALLLITILAFIFSNNEKYAPHIMFGVFVFLILFFLPFAFTDSGGSSNNTTGYTFLLVIVITYLFSGWRRIFLISILIFIFMLMHALEYYYPEIITVYSDQSQFVDRMIQMPLLLLASFIIILQFTKEYERVNKKLYILAKFDELTGLYNRRMFNKEIDKAFKSSEKPIYLAFLDLNNFKKVNDKWGHSVGDKALIELSGILQKTFGLGKHIISRWGGDEFAIIY